MLFIPPTYSGVLTPCFHDQKGNVGVERRIRVEDNWLETGNWLLSFAFV
jgi:hypothetical protein